MEKVLGIEAEVVAVSWPHASPLCPEIHTYSDTQRFTKIDCVIPSIQIGRSARLRLDGTLELHALTAVQSHQKYHQSLSISTAANALNV